MSETAPGTVISELLNNAITYGERRRAFRAIQSLEMSHATHRSIVHQLVESEWPGAIGFVVLHEWGRYCDDETIARLRDLCTKTNRTESYQLFLAGLAWIRGELAIDELLNEAVTGERWKQIAAAKAINYIEAQRATDALRSLLAINRDEAFQVVVAALLMSRGLNDGYEVLREQIARDLSEIQLPDEQVSFATALMTLCASGDRTALIKLRELIPKCSDISSLLRSLIQQRAPELIRERGWNEQVRLKLVMWLDSRLNAK